MHEAGLKGYAADQLAGMLAPKAISPRIVTRLEAALRKVTSSPEVLQAVLKSGNEVSFEPGEKFGATMKSEVKKWSVVIKEAGIVVN
jgi:tripartite-type tricarboxylate transporter receptor subunit TctC